MKNIFLVLIIGLLVSCADNNTTTDIDLSLVYGKWSNQNLCTPQNNIIFNDDKTYIQLYSGNSDCDTNEFDTYQKTGTYTIDSNDIEFDIQSSEIIIEGTDIGTPVSFESINIYTKIIKLTATEMIIETKFKQFEGAEDEFFRLDLVR